MAKDTVEVLIEGGSATPGPPLGPALGPFGINMMQVVDEINRIEILKILILKSVLHQLLR